MKKYLIFPLLLLTFMVTPAHAYVVTCTNCSNTLLQALERVTNMEQLSTMMKEYQEAVQQTQQQIRMVQQNIEQYQNMLQNTAQLPGNLVNELRGNLTRLANLSSNLKTLRGDVTALGSIFTNLFPEQGFLDGIAGASPADVDVANTRYRQAWDSWSANVDRAAQWRAFGFTALLILLLSVTGNVMQASQVKTVPYIVEVDQLGKTGVIARADTASNTPRRLIQAEVAACISNWRTVTADVELQQKMIDRLSFFMAGSAKGVMRECAQTP